MQVVSRTTPNPRKIHLSGGSETACGLPIYGFCQVAYERLDALTKYVELKYSK